MRRLLDCSGMEYIDVINCVYMRAKIDVSDGLKNLEYTLLANGKTLEIDAHMTPFGTLSWHTASMNNGGYFDFGGDLGDVVAEVFSVDPIWG